MASLCARLLARSVLRPHYAAIPCRTLADKLGPDSLELATGLEKREILAKLAGNDDPWQMNVNKRGLGTKEQPTPVPSAFDSRIVGCICEEDATHINWFWVHKGQAKRCECGHWYKLVETKPI